MTYQIIPQDDTAQSDAQDLNTGVSELAERMDVIRKRREEFIAAGCLRRGLAYLLKAIVVELSYGTDKISVIETCFEQMNKIREDLHPVQSTDRYVRGCVCKGEKLLAGQTLGWSEYLLSENKRFAAVMQPDNNFVVYNSDKPLWASGTYGGQGKGYIEFGVNGLISMSGINRSWDTKRGGAKMLIMENNGNLTAYTEDRTPVWSTNPKVGQSGVV